MQVRLCNDGPVTIMLDTPASSPTAPPPVADTSKALGLTDWHVIGPLLGVASLLLLLLLAVLWHVCRHPRHGWLRRFRMHSTPRPPPEIAVVELPSSSSRRKTLRRRVGGEGVAERDARV